MNRASSFHDNVLRTLMVIAAVTPAASAQTYRIQTLPPLNANGDSGGFGINDAGIVVGQGYTLSGSYRAMRWDNVTPMDLGALPGFNSLSKASGISNDNRIVGQSGQSCIPADPTLWQTGQMTPLPDIPRVSAEVYKINDAGVAIGEGYDSCTRPWNDAAFQWYDNSVSLLPPLPGDPEAGAYGIDSAGVVVGLSGDSSGAAHLRACRWDNGVPSLVPDLGGDYSIAFGINDVEQIVGYSRTPSGDFRGYFDNGTTVIDVGTLPGYAYSSAMGVNNAGTVIGFAFNDPTGETVVYPNFVPDPNQRAILWRNGVLYEVASLIPAGSGWTSLNALLDINERGQITGYGFRGSHFRAFRLTPECLFDGDLNDDRAIDLNDLTSLLSDFGCSGYVCPGDITGDGAVDLADLTIQLANFGATCP